MGHGGRGWGWEDTRLDWGKGSGGGGWLRMRGDLESWGVMVEFSHYRSSSSVSLSLLPLSPSPFRPSPLPLVCPLPSSSPLFPLLRPPLQTRTCLMLSPAHGWHRSHTICVIVLHVRRFLCLCLGKYLCLRLCSNLKWFTSVMAECCI